MSSSIKNGMRGLVMASAVFLSACAALRGPEPGGERYWLKPDAPTVTNDAVSLLYYASYARNLNNVERDRETERQRSAYQRDRGDFRRLQYALLLTSLPDAGANDRRFAQQLIEPLLDGRDGRHDADLAALAGLLNAGLNAQKRGDELAQKLDAVKDIERSLMRREKGKP